MRRTSLAILALALGIAVASAPGVARAQEPAPEVQLVPPRLMTPLTPSYPEGAEGDASVILAVTVGPDGNVRDVQVVEGAEPFATQAIATLQGARFVPASREGIPVAATIRFQIDFTRPKPPPEAPPAEERAPPEPARPERPGAQPTAPPPPMQDVVVRGGRSNVSSSAAETLSRAEVRQLPGAFGDPFRAIEIAPGLAPVITGLPYFYVRGAPPGNVGYYFDGVRVPYLFHFGLGPAVVHPALIARTDLYKGGYPAAFGRYAGGIVDGTAMPPADRAHGEGLLRVIDAGGLIEAPFANGRGSALAAGRYSYTAALFSVLQSDTTLDYRDYQTRVAYALSDRDSVSLLGFGAYDLASQRELVDPSALGITLPPNANPNERREITRVLFASEFHRADLRWDHALPNAGHLRVAGTVGYDRTRVESRRAAEDVMTGLRTELVQPVGKNVVLRAGGDVVVDQYSGNPLPRFADDDDVVDRQLAVFADRTDFAAGVHVDAVLDLLPHVEVVPGARLDVFGSGGQRALSVDPRLAARFDITDRFRIVQAYGLASQAPSTPVVLPAIAVAGLRGGLQRAVQTSAGVEWDLPSDLTATGSVFHNAFYDLNDALGTAQVELIDIERSDTLLEKSRGSAYGLELGLRRKVTQRLFGLVAYTLSRSERTQGPRRFLSAYDRPHVANAVASYDLGRGWRAGARFVFYSGVPTVPTTPSFPEQVVAVPPERTPPFLRLDLRLEKRWHIGQRGWVSLVLEALNATLSKEVTGYRCGTALALPGRDRPSPTCVERVVGPVSVPSLGVEGGF